MRLRLALPLVVAMVAACACGSSEPAARSSSTVSPPPPRFMLVPGLVGLPLDDATELLASHGLTVGEVRTGRSPCLDQDVIVEQDPTVDVHLPPGASVDLTVNRPAGACERLPAAPPELRRIAHLFLRFAQGTSGYPPADTPIDLYLGGRRLETIPASRLGDAAAWRTCPEGGTYAGATCPFSAVDALRSYPGTLAITTAAPTHPCAHPTRISGMAGRSVTLTPREPQDCTSYFAVQLFSNEVGQVTAVNLVLAEP
jgi:PASTA domain-containing protein